ncbi:hypothetical protein LXA43DRAFT_907964 [Ganoderma leucocontextum]|nr:hypothetical protein LXA43DRAFT_907964 [Ganoderma leucocontextum]
MVISDCCCHVARAIHDVFPDAVVCLDVWRFLMRYLICLVGGSKCPVRADVARDIVDTVLKCRAREKTPAVYWSKEEQETRLEAAFKKWDAKAVWSAAGAKAHEEQLAHVRKGCLARPRDDVRADGSRIEGSHKGWNSLQRSSPSGLEMMAALGHDFVLHHNMRIESALKNPPNFTCSTFRSHHIHLVNDCAQRWNKALGRKDKNDSGLGPLPVLDAPPSGETFSMMKMSSETAAHQSLASIKKEPADEEQELLGLSSQDLLDPSYVLSEAGIDPSLLYQLPQASTSAACMAAHPAPLQSSFMTPHPCTRAHAASIDVNIVSPSSSSHMPHDVSPPTFGPETSPSDTLPPTSSTPPVGITDLDDLCDLESQDRKVGVMKAAEMDADIPPTTRTNETNTEGPDDNIKQRVDRKGKGVDCSAIQGESPVRQPSCVMFSVKSIDLFQATSTRKCRTPESSHSARPPKSTVIEISDDDDDDGSSQPKPPPRKKLRLHGATLDSFFHAQSQSNTAPTVPDTTYFPRPTASGLTRSQRMFSIASGGINPRSLSLSSIDYEEFKLFLQLRARYRWTTSTMSPYHWVCAASAYNKGLEQLNESTDVLRPLKTPRALMDKLFQLEPKLIAQIISDDYDARSGRSPRFWYPHCHVFPLEVGGKSGAELTAKLINGKKITVLHTCHRCKKVMYPGPANSPLNHPRGICNDQVWQTARAEKTKGDKVIAALDEPPPFPQPEKLFTADKDGHYFHVDRLMTLLRDFYLRIMAGVAGSGLSALYDIAFAQLLQARVKIIDATPTSPTVALFRPYRNVRSIGLGEGQMYPYCGEEWIRLDYLSVNDNVAFIFGENSTPQAYAGPSQPGPSQASSSDSLVVTSPPGPSRAGTWEQDLSRAGSSEPDRSRASSSQSGLSSRASSSQPDLSSRASSSQPDLSSRVR